ncbi:glycerophosphodiester phosphodiesterase [Ornithobacterium rhinotracheale]|nr:glycerophosphodiester phosphodiesterase [Ornithobacterium rhinotracheale]
MMKKKLIIPFILLAISAIAQTRVDSIRVKLFNPNLQQVLVAAHRGDWRNSPENSLAAIENAIKMGVDIVEVDLQKTKDGHLILMHDSSIDRTTTGKGKVKEITLDSIRKVKLKNGCAIRTIHNVPTLEEALILAKGKVMLNLDKADRYFDDVFALLQKTGTTNQIIMKGGKSPANVHKKYGEYLKKVIYMPVINLDKPKAKEMVVDFVKDMKPVAFELVFKSKDNPLPKELKQVLKGKSLIWYNTLWDTLAGGYDDDMALQDRDAAYGYLINELGARIIQTDRPAYLLEYLREKKLHN